MAEIVLTVIILSFIEAKFVSYFGHNPFDGKSEFEKTNNALLVAIIINTIAAICVWNF